MRKNNLTLALLLTTLPALAYEQYVIAPDVVTALDAGQLRFCPRANLRGNICQIETKIFGKRRQQIQDWWYPETYVEAATGYPGRVSRVEPTPDDRGLIIFFE